MTLSRETEQLLEDLRRRPLSQLVAKRTKLRAAGTGKFKGRCPLHTEKTPSFYVDDRKASFICFGCSERGDAVSFLRKIDNLDFFEALNDAAAFYGLARDVNGVRKREYQPAAPPPSDEDEEKRRAKEEDFACALYKSAAPASGTAVERYLVDHRKIPLERLPGGIIPPTLKFLAACEYWHGRPAKLIGRFPAMVAPLQDITGRQRGIHITYLDPVTFDKLKRVNRHDKDDKLPAKKMRGTVWACAIRLAPVAEFMSTSEGIENGLSGMICGAPGCWVAGSLGNMAGYGIGEGVRHPRRIDKKLPSVFPDMARASFRLPPVTKQVLQLQDNDSRDQESADKLFERFLRRCRAQRQAAAFFKPDRHMDLNDMVKNGLLQPGAFQ